MNMVTPIDAETAHAEPLRERVSRMPRWQRTTAILLPVALLGVVGYKVFDSDPAVAAAPPPTRRPFANRGRVCELAL